jgi:hypothetical protein
VAPQPAMMNAEANEHQGATMAALPSAANRSAEGRLSRALSVERVRASPIARSSVYGFISLE